MKPAVKIKLSILSLLFVFSLIAIPHFVYAEDYVKSGLGNIVSVSPTIKGLDQNSTVGDVFVFVIKIALALSFAIAVIFVIYGGYLYITSGGNEEQATTGRRTVTYAVIGIILIILSFIIISVITNLVQGGPGSGAVNNSSSNCPNGLPPGPNGIC